MGHLSPYSKAELRLQSGCGKAMDGYITAKCGDIQPDMERHMCSECNKRWNEAVKKMH
jgi:hypothetical protein